MRSHLSHHTVIVGGGFAGLYAAKSLRRAGVKVTLVDKRNFHLFQPLLYQVATGWLSPGDIASPLRTIFSRDKNISVYMAEVTDIVPDDRKVILRDGELHYDTLVIATGTIPHYFGNDAWAPTAPGLKTIEDALEIRRRVLLAFEIAEREQDPVRRDAFLTFVVVGGGSAGVELVGALAEVARDALKNDFRNIDPAAAEIILLEAKDRILPSYPSKLSAKAVTALENLGVSVQTGILVTNIKGNRITIRKNEQVEHIRAGTMLWVGGTRGSAIGQVLASRTGAKLDHVGRVMVEPDLTLPDYPNIFVIGDLAYFAHQNGVSLPGLAPVAMQQGRYVANAIKKRFRGQDLPAFRYRDRGNLAVIGRNTAIARLGWLKFDGFLAWLAWALVHITYLIEFDNKLLVLIQWAWNYITRKRGTRLITGRDPFPLVETHSHQRFQDST